MSTNCGIVSLQATGSLHLRVTFAAVAGTAIPLASATDDPSLWVVGHGIDATITAVSVARVSDLVYDVALSHRLTPDRIVSLNTDAVPTDQGGWCEAPGDAECLGVTETASAATQNDLVVGPSTAGGEPFASGAVPRRGKSERRR